MDSNPIDEVGAVLARAQGEKFIGPGSLGVHVDHAQGFAGAMAGVLPPRHVVDLGSGGGLPSLVLAAIWPDASFLLIESNRRRAAFLREAIVGLGWIGRLEVTEVRAEDCGRDPSRRAIADLVTARGFGPPAVTAECAAPHLHVGGHLVVSGPPDLDAAAFAARWPGAGLAELGLTPVAATEVDDAHFALLRQEHLCGERFPRRVGIPAKRPLF